MGWKKIKEYYDIKHIVHVREQNSVPCILIGSGYISDIIVIRISDGKILKRYDGGRSNERLRALQPRLDEDEKNGTLKRLIDEQDAFGKLLPVYCIDNHRNVVRYYCEAYGWPNVTTTGKLMYDNTFYSQRRYAQYRLLKSARLKYSLRGFQNRFDEIWREVKRLRFNFRELYNDVYAHCIGRFYVKDYKE